MVFAETDAAMNLLLTVGVGLVVILTQIAKEWRDHLRAKRADARDASVKAALVDAELRELQRAMVVKDALAANTERTAEKLAHVETALVQKSEATNQLRNDVHEVRKNLAINTAATVETKDIVKSDRDNVVSHVKELQRLMEEHGITCPGHLDLNKVVFHVKELGKLMDEHASEAQRPT